ncbi:hypothetical protein RJ641_007551 [Dillenia turbinata]|uniref:C2H2-type domain-containing protein n=1 Tax=Dillenia turbinata TaxID=194707 RepID=A0AAN8Z5N0_9MAGN
MPVAKLTSSAATDVMKSEDGNDSLDNFIRQAVAKEPLVSFSRAGESPVQWIQLLHALDQQGGLTVKDLPGWPLLSPLKMQMHKCEKCSKEFCSTINYRRHMRVHRRSLNIDKDSTKNRDLLGAFWEKLSEEEAKEVVSFKDVILEEVAGAAIIRTLSMHVRKPGFSSLPQVCVKAGSALLDIVQGSRYPVSAQELFSILDDASEKTFLCAGTADTMQKYVFDGDAGKVGLEMRNVVACSSFLIEQKLVKAWLADLDAEALRCQKLLVEEEEAAQKRQAQLLERRKQKKLRQKEQKAREQRSGEKADKENIADSMEIVVHSSDTSSSTATDSDSRTPDMMPDHDPAFPEPIQLAHMDQDPETGDHSDYASRYQDLSNYQNIKSQEIPGVNRRQSVGVRWQGSKSQRTVPNSFHANPNNQVSKPLVIQRHGIPKDAKVAPAVNNNKVWTQKGKLDSKGEGLKPRVEKEASDQPGQAKTCEVLIGSIPVTLAKCNVQQHIDTPTIPDNGASEQQGPSKNNVLEKSLKPDSSSNMSHLAIKLWRPVSLHGSDKSTPESRNTESEVDITMEKGNAGNLSCESCPRPSDVDGASNGDGTVCNLASEEDTNLRNWSFSIHEAKMLLAERWKEAMTADHVTLVLTPDCESPGCLQKGSVLGNAENQLANLANQEALAAGTTQTRYRTKPEKGVKLKYIPKQRTDT